MKLNIKEFNTAIRSTLLKSPIETTLALLFYAVSCNVAIVLKEEYNTVWHNILWYFITCMAITYSLNIIFKTGTKRLFYYVSVLTPILFYFYIKDDFSFTTMTITTICSLLLIYVARNFKDNNKFTYNAISVTTNIITGGALTFAAVLAATSIISSITYIFDIPGNFNTLYQVVVYFGIFLLFPLLFLLFEYKESYTIKTNRFLEILFNYIFTLAIIIYGTILYVYFAKIVVLWTLPKGVISATAIGFIAGGIFVKACRIILDKKIVNWFFNYFNYISLPALAMLWVSVLYRILQYGFTGDRIYLLISVITLSVWIFASMCKKTDKYQYLTIFTIALYIIFTYVPYINAEDVEKRAVSIETTENNTPMSIYIYTDIQPDLNIDGFNSLYNLSEKHQVTDSNILRIEKEGKILFEKSFNEILVNIFKEAGIENYNSLSRDSLFNLRNKLNIYRDSNTIIVFDTLDLLKFKDSLTIKDVSIDYLITK